MKCLDQFKFDMQPGPSLGILALCTKFSMGPPQNHIWGGGGGGGGV